MQPTTHFGVVGPITGSVGKELPSEVVRGSESSGRPMAYSDWADLTVKKG